MVATLVPSSSTSVPSLAGVFLDHQGCLLVRFLSPSNKDKAFLQTLKAKPGRSPPHIANQQVKSSTPSCISAVRLLFRTLRVLCVFVSIYFYTGHLRSKAQVPFWVLSPLPGLPVLRWYLLQPQQQLLQLLQPSPSYVFCVSCAFYPFYASYPSFSSSSFHPRPDRNSVRNNSTDITNSFVRLQNVVQTSPQPFWETRED